MDKCIYCKSKVPFSEEHALPRLFGEFKGFPHPETGINILWEFNEGKTTVREVRQIVFIDSSGKSYPIRIQNWMKNVDQLRDEIKKQGLELSGGGFTARVFVDE